METPLHYINLLDKGYKKLVWTFAATVILTLLGYSMATISKVSNLTFLLDFGVEKNFAAAVFILTYLSLTSTVVFFVKEKSYLRNAVGELYAI